MKSKEEIDELYHKYWDDFSSEYDDNLHYYSFVEGYLQCQEDMAKDVEYWKGEFDHWHQQAMDMADKKYTEKDIRKAIKFGQTMELLPEYVPIPDFIKSLNKQD